VLVSHTGIIPSAALLEPPEARSTQLSKMMIWSWTNPDLSILAVPRRCMTSVIANATDGWQPYNILNPATLPQIPGVTYAYLEPPDRQAAACPPTQQ
jgi:hypothetical protein